MSEPSTEAIDVGDVYDQDLSDVDIPDYNPPHTTAADQSEPEEIQTLPDEDFDEEVEEPAAKQVPDYDAKKADAVAKAKKIGFKAGDQSVELLEDAVTDWKVDGKPVKVPLKELLQNYSGKVAWEKRFQEVSETRKTLAEQAMQFEQQRGRHSALINDMHKATKEGRTFDAISSMIQMTGAKIDAREYVKGLRDALIQQAQQLAGMSPEQRQVHEHKEEIEYLKSQGSRLQQQRESEQAQVAFQSRVANAISGVNSTVEEYVSTKDWLEQNAPKLLGDKWNAQQLTPEFVANQIRDVRDYRTAKEALEAVDPSLVKSEITWKQAVDMLRANPDWTAEDLQDVYRESTKQKRSQRISNKIAKSPTATTATASTARPKKAHRDDWSSFDERDTF
jgi:hypothetical protein